MDEEVAMIINFATMAELALPTVSWGKMSDKSAKSRTSYQQSQLNHHLVHIVSVASSITKEMLGGMWVEE